MKTKIILCSSLKFAFYEWHRLADKYYNMWANICRKPLSLTSTTGTKYIFWPEYEIDKLDISGDFISVNEVNPQESEE